MFKHQTCSVRLHKQNTENWTHNLVISSPDVVVSTEDHATFCVARCADLTQLGLAAGALEASAVPVAVHGVKEETVRNFAPAAGAPLPGQRTCAHRWWLAAASGIHHRTWEHTEETMTGCCSDYFFFSLLHSRTALYTQGSGLTQLWVDTFVITDQLSAVWTCCICSCEARSLLQDNHKSLSELICPWSLRCCFIRPLVMNVYSLITLWGQRNNYTAWAFVELS